MFKIPPQTFCFEQTSLVFCMAETKLTPGIIKKNGLNMYVSAKIELFRLKHTLQFKQDPIMNCFISFHYFIVSLTTFGRNEKEEKWRGDFAHSSCHSTPNL